MKFPPRILWLVLAALLLTASFARNAFRIVEPDEFQTFQNDSLSLIELKMVEVQRGSELVEGGFLRMNEPFFQKRGDFTYETIDLAETRRYNSQFGLQGMIAAWSQRIAGAPVDITVAVLQNGVAGLLALTLVAFLARVAEIIDGPAAVIGFVLLLCSPILNCFARNLYWVPFTLLLPFVAAFWLYPAAFDSRKRLAAVFLAIYGTVLIKSLCGYEYITDVVLAPSVAVVYFAFRRGLPLRRLVRHGLAVCVAGSLGFATALVLHWAFLAGSLGSPEAGWQAIAERASANTFREVDPGQVDRRVSFVPMLLKYQIPVALNFGSRLQFGSGDFFLFKVSYAGVLLLAVGAGVFLAQSCRGLEDEGLIRRRQAAIMATGWALVAAFSWFFLARNHNQHFNMNNIVFHLPFMPTLSVLLGESLRSLRKAFRPACRAVC